MTFGCSSRTEMNRVYLRQRPARCRSRPTPVRREFAQLVTRLLDAAVTSLVWSDGSGLIAPARSLTRLTLLQDIAAAFCYVTGLSTWCRATAEFSQYGCSRFTQHRTTEDAHPFFCAWLGVSQTLVDLRRACA
jgi:hypothetical protein